MKNLLTMIRLKLRLLIAHPGVLLFCLVTPVLLSLLAGSTIKTNDFSRVKGAYADCANNEASAQLIDVMVSEILDWVEVDEREGRRMMMRDEIDGLVIIPEEYGEMKEGETSRENALTCDFIPGSRSFAADMVREHFMLASLVISIKDALVEDLISQEAAIHSQTDYQTMMRRLEKSTIEERKAGRDVRVEMHDYPKEQSMRLVQVPDLAIDVMFLSIFALLGRMMTTSRATTVRMAALPGGFRRDYIASIITLFIAGLIELFLLAGITGLLMSEAKRPPDYFLVMIAMYVLLLALGQFFASFGRGDRFVPASLLLFCSMMAGGSFIRLPSFWIRYVGQYTPQGWALAQLEGFNTLFSLPLILIFSAVFFVLAFFIQRRRAREI
ncbi:MAG: ABC transporter permease [Clostridiaceae bacterium]|jgi:hypothetical protein|nr:ABC transporter permease [Clostridiaceae bacterium]